MQVHPQRTAISSTTSHRSTGTEIDAAQNSQIKETPQYHTWVSHLSLPSFLHLGYLRYMTPRSRTVPTRRRINYSNIFYPTARQPGNQSTRASKQDRHTANFFLALALRDVLTATVIVIAACSLPILPFFHCPLPSQSPRQQK